MGGACSRLIGGRDKFDPDEVRRCRGFRAHQLRKNRTQHGLLQKCLETLAANSDHLALRDIRKLSYDMSQELFDAIVSIEDMTLEKLRKFTQQHLWRLSIGWCRGVADSWVVPFAGGLLLTVDLTETKISDSSLKALSTCLGLRELILTGCSCVTSYGFLQLKSLAKLEVLDASECMALDSYGMVALRGLVNLRTLNLSGCFLVSPQHVIVSLPTGGTLKHLDLSWCQAIASGSAGANAWKAAASVTHLNLSKAALEQKSFQGLACLTNLVSLNLSAHTFAEGPAPQVTGNVSDGPRIDSHAMKMLGQLTRLTTLQLKWCTVPDQSWHYLADLTNLNSLDVGFTDFGDPALHALAPLKALAHLNLDSTEVTDNGLDVFGQMPAIETLNLSDTRVQDRGVPYLHSLKSLSSLDLSYSSISDYGVEQVAALTTLTYLSIDSRLITSKGLKCLWPLTNLVSLDVFGCKMTEPGAAVISKLPKVTFLECAGGTLCDKTVATLSSMTQLTYLSLNQNREISDFAFPCLAKLTNLVSLNISSTGMTSAGLGHLHGLPSLASLSVYGLHCQRPHMMNFMMSKPDTDLVGYER